MTMLAPALARPSAIALPIPLLPPVTIATLSFSDMAFAPLQGEELRLQIVAGSLTQKGAVCRQSIEANDDRTCLGRRLLQRADRDSTPTRRSANMRRAACP